MCSSITEKKCLSGNASVYSRRPRRIRRVSNFHISDGRNPNHALIIVKFSVKYRAYGLLCQISSRSKQLCVQLPTYADNVAFAGRTPLQQQSIDISCPQQTCRDRQTSKLTDRRTPYRFIDRAPPYYASIDNNVSSPWDDKLTSSTDK